MLKTYARNPHELARVLECETRITCSEAFIRGGLARLEAEAGGRVQKGTMVFNRFVSGKLESRFAQDQYWLRAPYQPGYLENYRIHTGKEDG